MNAVLLARPLGGRNYCVCQGDVLAGDFTGLKQKELVGRGLAGENCSLGQGSGWWGMGCGRGEQSWQGRRMALPF